MRTPASIAKHPIHPMLVAIPIGLWGFFSLIGDLISVAGYAGAWPTVAFYTMVIAIGLLLISGWLGGKMVYVHGVAVDAASDMTTPARRWTDSYVDCPTL